MLIRSPEMAASPMFTNTEKVPVSQRKVAGQRPPSAPYCEIGVIAPLTETLTPSGIPGDTAAIRDARPPRSDDGTRRTAPVLLGAVRTPEGLAVQLSRKAESAVTLELSHRDSDPDELSTWQPLGEVPAGAHEHLFAGDSAVAEGGSRVRAAGPDGPGSIVFVTDPVRTRRKPGASASKAPTTTPDELFTDPMLAEQFARSLADLRIPGASVAAAATRSRDSAEATVTTSAHTGWQVYLDSVHDRLGLPLVNFALGLPLPEAGRAAELRGPMSVSVPAWYEDFASTDETGLDDDNVEPNAGDEPSPAEAMPDLSERREHVRRRYQLWARRLAKGIPHLDDPVRQLAALHLVICTVGRWAWPVRDRSWIPLLADAVCGFAGNDFPEEVLPSAGSLAAVALAVLYAEVAGGEYDEETLAYERASREASHLLVGAEHEHIAEYTRPLARAYAGALHPETVLDLCDRLVQGDVVADAVDRLTARGRLAHRRTANLMEVSGSFGNPSNIALEAVSLAGADGPLGAWAVGSQGRWAFIAWSAPDLVEVSCAGPGRPLRWRHFRLTGIATPGSLLAGGGLSTNHRVDHGPQNRPFPLARQLLSRLGLDEPNPQPPRATS